MKNICFTLPWLENNEVVPITPGIVFISKNIKDIRNVEYLTDENNPKVSLAIKYFDRVVEESEKSIDPSMTEEAKQILLLASGVILKKMRDEVINEME